MMPSPEPSPRWHVYSLLITVAVGLALGRISSVERVYEPSLHRPEGQVRPGEYLPGWPRTRPDPWPIFSSNDRSRWAAVRSLVDEGTFVIGRRNPQVVLASGPAVLAAGDPLQAVLLLAAGYQLRVSSDTGIVFEDGWQTVDKVLHPARLEFYSTKPPLLTVLAAGEYWLLKKWFGWSIVAQRWQVIPTILGTFNVLPLVLYLWLLACLLERWGSTDWGRYYVLTAACFGTMVSPFLVSFNNHTIATCTTLLAVYAVVRVLEGGGRVWFLVAGLAAGLTACNELPATALAAGLFVYLLWRWPTRTLVWFLPVALLPAVALVATNYAELGQIQPAYAEFGGPWYQYEGSHWRLAEGQVKYGIDWAWRSESKAMYALHLLIGHHGVFSLTPIMLLAAVGMVRGAWGVLSPKGQRWIAQGEALGANTLGANALPELSTFALLLSLVVLGFYIFGVKSTTANYGGWSNGPRWLMWLTPLWLLTLLPVADRLAHRRAGQGLALVLLAVSVLSMSYQQWNPWRHPWLYAIMEQRGWIRY